MSNESLAKLVHELVHDPGSRKELLEGKKLSTFQISDVERKALKKVFSRHSLISAVLITSTVPFDYWM